MDEELRTLLEDLRTQLEFSIQRAINNHDGIPPDHIRRASGEQRHAYYRAMLCSEESALVDRINEQLTLADDED